MDRKDIMTKFLSTTIGTDGLLNATQARLFIDEFVQTAELMPLVTRQIKTERSGTFYSIDMSQPATVAATEGTEYTNETGEVTYDKYAYNVVKRRTQFEMTWEDEAWTIEGAGFKQHIVNMWLQRWGVDTEALGLLGEGPAAIPTPVTAWEKLYAINEGWLPQITVANGCHIIDADGATPTFELFAKAFNNVPNKYLRFAKRNYRWMTSTHVISDYRNYLSSRQTGLGDAIINGRIALSPQGVPFAGANGEEGFAVFPETLGTTEDQGVILLMDPKALVWFVHRDMKLLNRFIQEKDSFRYTGYHYDDFIVTQFPSIVRIDNVGRDTTYE